MLNYNLYNGTFVFMALYLKKQSSPHTTAVITRKQYFDYMNLVMRNIEKERRVANAFTYTILDGEPQYKFRMLDEKKVARINKTNYYYDAKTDSFYTPNEVSDLYYKSATIIPSCLLPQFTPQGYEKALGIKIEEVNEADLKANYNRKKSTSGEPGSE